jgi:hypothetical protein
MLIFKENEASMDRRTLPALWGFSGGSIRDSAYLQLALGAFIILADQKATHCGKSSISRFAWILPRIKTHWSGVCVLQDALLMSGLEH